MSFRDGENHDLTSENMKQEEKFIIEDISINLNYVKQELENEETEFQETQYKIALDFENIFQESSEQRNNEDSLIGFLNGDVIMKTDSVKLEDVKEENKDLKQETIEQSPLVIIQCHCCKVQFEKWEHLENHMLHCLDEKYNRFNDNKLDIQRKPGDEIEEIQENCEILIPIDDNRSCSTRTETKDSKYGINKTSKEGSFSEKKHKCSECSYQTNHKKCLKLHIINRHSNTNEKKYKCSECSFQSNHNKSLKLHILNRHSNTNEKKYKCSECSYQSNYKICLELHILNQHSNTNEKKYKCTECSYQTNCKSSLRCHLKIHNNTKPFECHICKKRVSSKMILNRHVRDLHSNANEKKYKCTECSYQTNYKGTFEIHLNMHNKIKPFECEICKKKFTRKEYLKTHLNIHNEIDNNEKKHNCSECSYQSHQKFRLKLHILNRHSNKSEKETKQFECDTCKKRFNRKDHLTMHIAAIHSNTNEKKYKCTECSYQTHRKDRLKLHMSMNIHSNTNETHYNSKPFECDICKNRFSKKANLNRHIMTIHSTTNKQYKCTECSYQTIYKERLKVHLVTHNKIKPFECEICKKRLTRKCHLKVHIMNIHSNQSVK